MSDWKAARAADLRELADAVERGECDALAVVWRHAPTGQRMMHGSASPETGEVRGSELVVEIASQLLEWVEFPWVTTGEA